VFPQFRSDNDGLLGTLMQGNGYDTQNGLPANNSDFGVNSVTHLFQGAPLDVSNIEVFYAAGAYTHPVGDTRFLVADDSRWRRLQRLLCAPI